MRTLKQISESILKIFYGGELTDDRKFTIRQVAILVMQERDRAIREDLWENMKEGGGNPSSAFFKEFDTPFLWDSAQNVVYLDLPATAATLPDDKGIGSIRPMGKFGEDFTRIMSGSLTNFRAVNFEEEILWEWVTGRKVRIHNMHQGQYTTATVRMIPIDEDPSTSLNEPLLAPGYMDSIIRDRVLAAMGYRRSPADDTNDDRDQT